MPNSERIRSPWWLKPANRIFIGMSLLGMSFGWESPVVLAVPGRKSGKLRSTPVTPIHVNGKRYVVGSFPGADWVKNVRAAGKVTLRRGRRTEHVRMVEMLPEEARQLLRGYPTAVPTGVRFMKNAGTTKTADLRSSRRWPADARSSASTRPDLCGAVPAVMGALTPGADRQPGVRAGDAHQVMRAPITEYIERLTPHQHTQS